MCRPAPEDDGSNVARVELPAMTISGKASRYQSSVLVSSATARIDTAGCAADCRCGAGGSVA
jgi:hypothetical protein